LLLLLLLLDTYVALPH